MRKIVHIGAHRTGTTSIQTALSANIDQLHDDGITAITAVGAREIFFDPLQKFAESTGEEKNQFGESLRVVTDEINKEAANSSLIIYSEENLLGDMDVVFEGERFGKQAEENLAALREFIGNDFEIVFSIRDYASYFNSIFTYKYGKSLLNSFVDYREILLSNTSGWYDLAARVQKLFPANPLTIVPFEFYKDDFSLFYPIMGIPADIKFETPRENRTRSSLAIRRLEKRIKSGEVVSKEAMQILVKRAHKFPYQPYETWSDEEKILLKTRYTDDIAKIKTDLNVNFIQ